MSEEQGMKSSDEPVPAKPIVLEYAAKGREEKPRTGLVTVGRYLNGWEAHLAAGKLEAEGIAAAVVDENMTTTGGGLYVGLTGGIKVQVAAGDVERALAVLPRSRGVSPVYCPKCRSIETHEIPLSAGVRIFFLLLLGLPYLFIDMRWACIRCGNVWKRSIHSETEVVEEPVAEDEDDEADEVEEEDEEGEEEEPKRA